MNKIKGDTPFHEFAHPFEQLLKQKNPTLWKSLVAKAKRATYNGKSIDEFVRERYPELNAEDLASETIVTAIGIAASDPSGLAEGDTTKGLLAAIKSFFKWLVNYMNSLQTNPDKMIKVEDLHESITLKHLSKILFETDNQIDFEDMKLSKVTFYQKADETFSKLKTIQENSSLDEATHKYTFNGKEASGSVTDLVKAYYEETFTEKEKTEQQLLIDDILKERGTDIHKDIESIVNRMIDPSTGLLRKDFLPIGTIKTSATIYAALEDYLVKRFVSLGDNVRFMSEVRIYDESEDRAGTIDLLAIKENGEVEIFDWKSIQTRKGLTKIEELPWYKIDAYRVQLREYKRILEQVYGTKVVNAMAIPIEANITFLKNATGRITNGGLASIKFGDIDPTKIDENEDYLVPVVLKEQSTGIKELDELIFKLNGLYDKTKKERVRADGIKKEEKSQKLQSINKSIRDLQVKKTMESFIENGNVIIKNIDKRIKENRIDAGYIEDAIGQLRIYQNAQQYLIKLIRNSDIEDKTKLSTMQSNAAYVLGELVLERQKLAESMANEVGIQDITKAERKMDWMKSTFRSLSTLPIRTIRAFYKKLVLKQNQRDVSTDKLFKELTVLKDDLSKWASSNGISNTNMFDKLYQHDDKGNKLGKFITKYVKTFYSERTDAIKAKDLKWFNDNTTFDKKLYDEKLIKVTEYYNNQIFASDPTKNEEKRKKALETWIINHDASKYTAAVFNVDNEFMKPKDKHISKEWIELQNTPALKAVFDKFQEILRYSHKIGMLDEQTGTFIPNIEASKIDRIVFGGASDLFNVGGLFDKLEVKLIKDLEKLIL